MKKLHSLQEISPAKGFQRGKTIPEGEKIRGEKSMKFAHCRDIFICLVIVHKILLNFCVLKQIDE